MIRTRTTYNPVPIKRKQADAILCSDIHLREDTPTCWIGDFQKEQWDALNFVKVLQEVHSCPVFHAGDLFHHWKPSPWLLSRTTQNLPKDFISVYGQHDLPQHNIELVEKCGMWNLMLNGKLCILQQGHWGWEPLGGRGMIIKNRETLVWHHMTYIKPPFPGASGGQADTILRKYPQFDLIVTGDNHQSFSTSVDGRLLVNPGSLTRQTADQIDFQPRVALWYAETNTIEWVNIPIQQNAITREHLEVKEQRNERIGAFISKLDGDWVAGMSFEENLKAFFEKNNTRDSVKQIIYTAIE
ncbi:MAG: hypothetical protein GYA51_11925 [Candidatus Methanofastidiosa archaeon]|nr:hypothetical protein [Candidatus Methanofastidiosa archaeon]